MEDSPEDMAAYGHTPDSHFAYFVTHDDDAPEFRIIDFPSVKGQALWSCQERVNGLDGVDATNAVERQGGYTEDQARAITSAGAAIYCPWTIKKPPPGE